MKKFRFSFFVLCFCLLVFISNAQAKDFTFAVFGDSRPTNYGNEFPPVFYQIIEEVNAIGPKLCCFTGDLVYGYGEPPLQCEDDYIRAKAILEKIESPVYIAPGNHEYAAKEGKDVYEKLFFSPTYYSFDENSIHFIFLDTEIPEEEGTITGEQLNWLKEDLEKNKDKLIFVFMHRPMFSLVNPDFDPNKKESFTSKENRDLLVDLFAKYRVKAVFSGHEHAYYRKVVRDVEYITTGGGGAPMLVPPQEGGFAHYIIVKVKENNQIDIKVYEPYHLLIKYVSLPEVNAKELREEKIIITNANYEDMTLEGLKVKVLKGKYELKTDTNPPKVAMGEWGKDVPAEITSVEPIPDSPYQWIKIKAKVPNQYTSVISIIPVVKE